MQITDPESYIKRLNEEIVLYRKALLEIACLNYEEKEEEYLDEFGFPVFMHLTQCEIVENLETAVTKASKALSAPFTEKRTTVRQPAYAAL